MARKSLKLFHLKLSFHGWKNDCMELGGNDFNEGFLAGTIEENGGAG